MQLNVPRSLISLGNTLGCGSFGALFVCELRPAGQALSPLQTSKSKARSRSGSAVLAGGAGGRGGGGGGEKRLQDELQHEHEHEHEHEQQQQHHHHQQDQGQRELLFGRVVTVGPEATRAILTEAMMLPFLKHENILQLVAVAFQQQPPYLVGWRRGKEK